MLERYLEVSQAEDVATFQRRLIAMAQGLGFDLVTGALVVENPLERGKFKYHAVRNAPAEYLEAAQDKSAVARDPVIRRLKALSVPFTYDQGLYVKEGAADLWEEQAQYGYKVGVAVALHLPDHKHFLLGVDREQALPESSNELIRMMADLQFLAVHAQAAATRLFSPERPPSDLPTLTEREKEILRWTQEGKSNWAIGAILGLSEEGVRYHLRSIFKKLDASSKHHAVLKAINLGLI